MAKPYFQFKQFIIYQDRCAMKVTTDACLFGAWCSREIALTTQKIKTLLDIGTGTGLLSLMIAQQHADIGIDAVEIEEGAYSQAMENKAASPWQHRIHITHEDIRRMNPVRSYDAIISNPPFYQNEIKSSQHQRNLALHSSELTFDALLAFIQTHLSGNGIFFLLVPFKRMTEIEKLLKAYHLFTTKKVLVKQSPTHDYFRVLLRGSKVSSSTEMTELCICNDGQQYTVEFIHLLQDYYLHL